MATQESTPDAEFPEILGSLQSLALSSKAVETFLEDVTRLAARLVDPPASVGVTTRYDGRPVTVAASDERAGLIDEEQYGAGDGPCLTAMREAVAQSVEDVDGDDRWPDFLSSAREHGVLGILALPLVVHEECLGALNIYTFDDVGRITDEQVRRAEVFAAQAATALALTRRHLEETAHAVQLEQALRSRSVIDQAVGVLMGQQRCDAAAAFALLRQHSQNNNLKLRDVARSLIERHTGNTVAEAPLFHRAVHSTAADQH